MDEITINSKVGYHNRPLFPLGEEIKPFKGSSVMLVVQRIYKYEINFVFGVQG